MFPKSTTALLAALAIAGCLAPGGKVDPPESQPGEPASPDSDTDSGESTAESRPEESRPQEDSNTDTACPPDSGVTTQVELNIEDVGLKLVGEEGDDAGRYVSVAAGGDADGDGFPDILVGMAGNDRGGDASGATYLVRGPLSESLDLAQADAIIEGMEYQLSGSAVAFAGDTNADGIDDLLIGAPFGVYTNGEGPGQAYLLFGPVTVGRSLQDADVVLTGEWEDFSTFQADTSWTGGSVAPAGDMNGDGFGDILVGAPGYGLWSGAAYALFGPVSGSQNLADADLRVIGAGWVSSVGDTNGDGLDDVALTGSSEAMVFYGPASGNLLASDADARLEDLGVVSTLTDTNNDGYADVFASDGGSSWGVPGGGAAYVFQGPVVGNLRWRNADIQFLGANEGGMAVGDALADTNGDGAADAVFGEPGGRGSPGDAYVVFGPLCGTSSLADADVVLHGQGDDWITFAVAAADIDLDGLDDILLSGQGDDDGGEDAGAAWLVLGSSLR
jgi:hypothetical protein